MRTAGFILVGGKSSRMGRDKALLPIGSQVLVQHLAGTLSALCDSVTLVGTSSRYSHLGINTISDLHPGGGPVAGIESALASAIAGDLNVIVSCDLPGLEVHQIRPLLDQAIQSQALCTAARDEDGCVHPLCAVYRRDCLPLVAAAFKAGERRARALLRLFNTQYVTASVPIVNVNTPEEWTAWQQAH